jgi:hypothetical protein
MTNNHNWHIGFFLLEPLTWLSLENARNDLKNNSKCNLVVEVEI